MEGEAGGGGEDSGAAATSMDKIKESSIDRGGGGWLPNVS
jgi:hypothetical protein